MTAEEFDRILKAAEQIKSDSDVLVVIGYRWILPWCESSNRLLEPPLCKLANKEERKAPTNPLRRKLNLIYLPC